MAIYRADQAQLTFGPEAAAGGYVEISPADLSVSGGSTTLASDHEAGVREITVSSATNFSVGDHIAFDRGVTVAQQKESELRVIEHISGTTFTLNAPTAFFHASSCTIKEVNASSITSSADRQYITLIPGVYETVDLPDPEMSIEPRYFLGTASKRNFHSVYSGQQSYTGSIGSFVLLNGRALRFPIGKVSSSTTYTNDVTAMKRTFATALKKGEIYVTLGATSGDAAIATTTKVMFGRGTTSCEVRQAATALATNTAGTITLDYPLQFDHAAGDMHVVGTAASNTTIATTQTIPYTHTITETVDLDSISWNAHMRASNETATYDLNRRYFGGKVGSASISADEGGMVMMSWDSVNFLGMIHNQLTNSNGSVAVPFYSMMETIDSDGVDTPTTDPYYFSNGEVTIFGQTIARIRSFSLSINNNEEPRYYVSKQMGRRRGPSEIKEQRREYSLAVTLALPDAGLATTAARTLFNELLLEGDYGSGKTGFNVSITFTRGNVVTGFEDKMTITIPDDGTSATGGNQQGAFIRSAPHDFGTDNPFQVDADILFRNLKIEVQDSEHYYP
tara:strand:+ start:1691 stop:3382 length:1692 start_codon:yes stop_codon:yes gene_type:complete